MSSNLSPPLTTTSYTETQPVVGPIDANNKKVNKNKTYDEILSSGQGTALPDSSQSNPNADSTIISDNNVVTGAFDIHQPWEEPLIANKNSTNTSKADIIPCMMVFTPPIGSTIYANSLAMLRFSNVPCLMALNNGTSYGYDISLYNSPQYFDNGIPRVSWDFALSLISGLESSLVNQTGGWLWQVPLLTKDQSMHIRNWSDWYIRVDEWWHFKQSDKSVSSQLGHEKMLDLFGMIGPFTLTQNMSNNSSRVLFMEPLRTVLVQGPTTSNISNSTISHTSSVAATYLLKEIALPLFFSFVVYHFSRNMN